MGRVVPGRAGRSGSFGCEESEVFLATRLEKPARCAACSSMPRTPIFLSGDLHALAHGAIESNGKHDLRHNPVHSVLTGPISTGPKGWPSSARGIATPRRDRPRVERRFEAARVERIHTGGLYPRHMRVQHVPMDSSAKLRRISIGSRHSTASSSTVRCPRRESASQHAPQALMSVSPSTRSGRRRAADNRARADAEWSHANR